MAAQDSISHFCHPGHELVKRHHVGPSYLCDMCWEHLTGPAYGCSADCDFAIHESCAGDPLTLSSPELHAHELVLVQTHKELVCDVCVGRCAPRCFLYRCPPCGFDMHPRCARLARTAVRSTRHSEHDLTLVLAEGSCAVCHDDQYGAPGRGCWFYRCAACNVDLHVSCASGDGEAGSDAGARSAGNNHALALAAELMGARLQAKGYNAALDLLSSSDPEERRRNHFYI